MKKLKLLALIYGPEDARCMADWFLTNAAAFEIAGWSEPLDVPIQSAVAHFCQTSGIDGLLIDAHHAYDPIVMSRLADLLHAAKISLYSTTNASLPVIGPAVKLCSCASNEDTPGLHLLPVNEEYSYPMLEEIRIAG